LQTELLIKYAVLPGQVTRTWLGQLQELIPLPLLQYVNKNKESVSLAHSLVGRLLLAEILKQQQIQTVTLSLNTYQRPCLVESAWKFSISHSHRMVICACSYRHDVGIDVEWITPVQLKHFISQFTESQLRQLSASENLPVEFFKLWTAKEAISKAVGKGLFVDFKEIIISDDGHCIFENQKWTTHHLNVFDSYCCTLATNSLLSSFQPDRYQIPL
jgi:phosphopantetheinyl transferase